MPCHSTVAAWVIILAILGHYPLHLTQFTRSTTTITSSPLTPWAEHHRSGMCSPACTPFTTAYFPLTCPSHPACFHLREDVITYCRPTGTSCFHQPRVPSLERRPRKTNPCMATLMPPLAVLPQQVLVPLSISSLPIQPQHSRASGAQKMRQSISAR